MPLAFIYWMYGSLILSLGGWLLFGTETTIAHRSILLLISLSMAYDCFAIAISPQLGFSPMLQQLNRLRFWLHHLTTPLLLVVCATLSNSPSGIPLAAFQLDLIGVWAVVLRRIVLGLLVLGLIAIGFIFEFQQPQLLPIACGGTVRYRLAGFCPLPSIVVTAAAAVYGLSYGGSGGIALLGAAIAVLAVNGIRRQEWKMLLSPIAELALLLALARLL